MKIRIALPVTLLVIAFTACQQQKIETKVEAPPSAIPASEAAEHIGEVQAVYGLVASARYIYWTRGQPTFMNLDEPYPDQIFDVIIWGLDREKFGLAPEKRFKGKAICVTGLIEEEDGIPHIVVQEPSQLQILRRSPVSEESVNPAPGGAGS
ncbi:MAG: hypothetical protein JSW54_11755 [Fidelibacterota bacterium]|nr:MAG: hypothetical protein JSW54_11755 [Candidatus Neomarinimicrobiota bacterium]